MKILFVWDFHGTLEKDNVLAVQEILNKVMAYYRLEKKITLAETVKYYGLSCVDYFHYLHPRGNLKLWNEMKEMVRHYQKKCCIVEKYIKPADYAELVLKTIKKNKHKNIVLSNSKPFWIRYFVKLVKLENYIHHIFGLDLHNIVRKNKDTSDMKYSVLKNFIKKNKFSKIIKIGDRDSDIKAGKMMGATTYYVKNKFNKNNKLKIKPDYIITDLREVLKEL